MKDKIIGVYDKWALIKQYNKNFYYFINDSHVSGTREELIDDLSYWKDTVDKNNEYMLRIENYFIDLLEKECDINE